MLTEKVAIKIFGREFELEWEGDPLYIYTLANYVDGKMREVGESNKIIDTGKVAVLTALTIADEYFRYKESKESNTNTVNKKTEEFIQVLETALK